MTLFIFCSPNIAHFVLSHDLLAFPSHFCLPSDLPLLLRSASILANAAAQCCKWVTQLASLWRKCKEKRLSESTLEPYCSRADKADFKDSSNTSHSCTSTGACSKSRKKFTSALTDCVAHPTSVKTEATDESGSDIFYQANSTKIVRIAPRIVSHRPSGCLGQISSPPSLRLVCSTPSLCEDSSTPQMQIQKL